MSDADQDGQLLTARERAFLEAHPAGSLTSETNSNGHLTPLQGVGGWLQFLIVALIFLGPALSTTMTYAEIRTVTDDQINQIGSVRWDEIKAFAWLFVAIYAILSVAAGILLAKRFQKSTVPIVIALLWLSGPILILIADAITEGATGGEGRAFGFATIWTIYLIRSKRVKNTYRAD